LQTYAQTYVREEVFAEQLVRNLVPFRRFLEIASQMNGQIINFSAIARQVSADDKTIQSYFQILEDTYIGFFVPGYEKSLRKQQSVSPKFYFFDLGVLRAIEKTLSLETVRGYTLGAYFETFIMNEIFRLNHYLDKEFSLSYLRTKDNLEVDLILERPRQKSFFIEIKSSDNVNASQLSSFIEFSKEFQENEYLCLSRDRYPKKCETVMIYPWKEGLDYIFS
jgi:predicted AAA+ superfamily ATPase